MTTSPTPQTSHEHAPEEREDRVSLRLRRDAAPIDRERAWAEVRALTRSHYENFSVLSRLVPTGLRDDFAAVYAYCRWSDDLADETGSGEAARDRSLELLRWWRSELERCFARAGGEDVVEPAGHAVFVALEETIRRRSLIARPFHHLLDAFEQDQRVTRYRTWEELLGYCRGSADPVGRIVLALAGYAEDDPANAERIRMSDATCTALQLTNFWQDARRDLVERDRVYMPSEETGIDAEELRAMMAREDDPETRIRFIKALRPLVERTRALFDEGAPLPRALHKDIAPVVWLFGAGGRSVLDSVERTGCTTMWTRPRLGKGRKAALVAQAWLMSRLGVFGRGGS